jgi:C4-dicarboxylate-specific signal transduction histidine kinase
MWWLIAVGVVVLALVVLVLVVLPVLSRLRGLDRAVRKARGKQAEVAVVQRKVADMQERLAHLQEQMTATAGRGTTRMPRKGRQAG